LTHLLCGKVGKGDREDVSGISVRNVRREQELHVSLSEGVRFPGTGGGADHNVRGEGKLRIFLKNGRHLDVGS
jgi:hypothetical protein